MNECKFCGKEVRFPVAVHAACWEREAEKVASIFCDNHCRWPLECNEEELADQHCNDCALVKIFNFGPIESEGEK